MGQQILGTEPIERVPAVRPVRLRKVGVWLLGVSIALNVLSMAIPALIDHPLTTERGEIRVYFDVFSEGNLPTWWSVGLLVLTAAARAVAVIRHGDRVSVRYLAQNKVGGLAASNGS